MSQTTACQYQIVVDGHLDSATTNHFSCSTFSHENNATKLQVTVNDQTELHGILAYMRDYNLPLVSLQRLGSVDVLAPK